MRLAVRKLDVADVGQLVQLVAENIESLEPGLSVIDARLLLGHATIDIAAVDGEGSLVLIALGATADEALLMSIVEAYSWCLEYPQAVQRLYPSLRVSAERPPRVIFVVERMPDSFQRKMRQLNFADVMCVEFRPLEVNGVAAILFDRVVGRRQTVAPRATERVAMPTASALPLVQPAITGPSLSGTNGHGVHANGHVAAPAIKDGVPDDVVPPAVVPVSEPPARLEVDEPAEASLARGDALDELFAASRTHVEMAEHAAPLADESAALSLPSEVTPLDPSALDAVLEEIGLDAAARVGDAREPVTEAEPDLALESVPSALEVEPTLEVDSALTLEPAAAVEAALEMESAAAVDAAPEVELTAELAPELEVEAPVIADVAQESAATIGDTPGLGLRALLDEIGRAPVAPPTAAKPAPTAPATQAPAPAAPAAPERASGLRGLLDEIAKAPSAPAPVAPTVKPVAPPAPAKAAAESTGLRGLVSEIEATLARGTTAPAAPTPPTPPVWAKVPATPQPIPTPPPAAAPTAVAPAAVVPAAAAKDLVAELPADFDNLKFPKDGVLTRQWMEFLNQMASSK